MRNNMIFKIHNSEICFKVIKMLSDKEVFKVGKATGKKK